MILKESNLRTTGGSEGGGGVNILASHQYQTTTSQTLQCIGTILMSMAINKLIEMLPM